MNKITYDFLNRNIHGCPKDWAKSLNKSSKIIFYGEPWITPDEYTRIWKLLLDSPQIGRLAEQIHTDPFLAAGCLEHAVNSGIFIRFKTELMPNKELEKWASEVIQASKKLKLLLSDSEVLERNRIFNLFMNEHIENDTSNTLPAELEHKDFVGVLNQIESGTSSWLTETMRQNRPNDKSYRKTRFVKKCGLSLESNTGESKPEVVAELTSIVFEDPGYTSFQARRILKNT